MYPSPGENTDTIVFVFNLVIILFLHPHLHLSVHTCQQMHINDINVNYHTIMIRFTIIHPIKRLDLIDMTFFYTVF